MPQLHRQSAGHDRIRIKQQNRQFHDGRSDPAAQAAWFTALKSHIKQVRDPFYLMLAGKTLARAYSAIGQTEMAMKYVDWALSVAAKANAPFMKTLLQEVKASFQAP